MTGGDTDAHAPLPAPAADGPGTVDAAHAADEHHAGSGHEQDHAADHGDPPPGPIDWGAWAVSAVGVGAGALVALVLFVAIQHG